MPRGFSRSIHYPEEPRRRPPHPPPEYAGIGGDVAGMRQPRPSRGGPRRAAPLPWPDGIVGRPGRAVQSAGPATRADGQGIGTGRMPRASTPDRGRSRGRRPGSAQQAEVDTHVSQGHHPGRRLGHAALPDHPRGEQAAPAGLRQADDLLPAVDADARRDPRGAADLDARRHRRLRAAAGRRQPVRDLDHLRRPAAPRRAGAGVPDRPRVRRRRPAWR